MNRQPCNRYLRKIKFLDISRESNHHSKRSCRNVNYNLQTSGDCHQILLRTTCGPSPLLIERFSHILPYFPHQCMNVSVILASLHQMFCHTQLGYSKRLVSACPVVRRRSSLGMKYTYGNIDLLHWLVNTQYTSCCPSYSVVVHLPDQRVTLKCSTFHFVVIDAYRSTRLWEFNNFP